MRTRDRVRLSKHIVATYEAATPAERAEGRSWYPTARKVAESLDPDNPSRAAAVIAVLSPRVRWERNIRLAGDAYAGLALACLKSSADKAERILSGESPDSVVSGPKTRAFWHAIVNPSDARAIVIDRHAIDVAFGETMDNERRGKLLGRKGAYDDIAQRYTFAAEILSEQFNTELTAVEVQATTWVTWKRLKKGFKL
jgi:hypothetical protein